MKIKIDSTVENWLYIITEKDIESTEDWISNNRDNLSILNILKKH